MEDSESGGPSSLNKGKREPEMEDSESGGPSSLNKGKREPEILEDSESGPSNLDRGGRNGPSSLDKGKRELEMEDSESGGQREINKSWAASIDVAEKFSDNLLASEETKGEKEMPEIEPVLNERKRSLAASIKRKLEQHRSPIGSVCIFRVHKKYRRINEHAYTPEIVSIGPFHHDKIHLDREMEKMENIKLSYMKKLLDRAGIERRQKILDDCVEAIGKIYETARACYSNPIDCDEDKFTRMMIVDGLFTIELFLRSEQIEKGGQDDFDDPIFNNRWMDTTLQRDMILLENQLPLGVLEKLFSIIDPKESDDKSVSLKELAIRFFNPLISREERVFKKCVDIEGKHLLDFLGKTLYQLPTQEASVVQIDSRTEVMGCFRSAKLWFRKNRKGLNGTKTGEVKHVPCVTELRKAGMKFKPRDATDNIYDIKFTDGMLEIPPLHVEDQTNTLLRNLIAYEQYDNRSGSHMTSYAFFMDCLINSPNDVDILHEKGIITNWLGSNEDVSCIFNTLCHEVCITEFHYTNLCNQMNEFYDRQWNKWFQDLREHFRTPWKAISIVVAALLLFLTLGQFVFVILDFIIPDKK